MGSIKKDINKKQAENSFYEILLKEKEKSVLKNINDEIISHYGIISKL